MKAEDFGAVASVQCQLVILCSPRLTHDYGNPGCA
jgi:hypothetical protein